MSAYRHTQVGWGILAPMIFVALVGAGATLFEPHSPRAALFVTGLLAIHSVIFFRLTVRVREGWLETRDDSGT